MVPATSTRTLSTAEERREAVIKAAIPIFAAKGFHAASTVEVAKAAGISQAYVFRLFPTKVDLYVALLDVARERMLETFASAAARAKHEGVDVKEAMGHAYTELVLSDRDMLLLQLGSQVASQADPRIGEAARRCFERLYELTREVTDLDDEEIVMFFAVGMLINTMASIEADTVDAPWAHVLANWREKC